MFASPGKRNALLCLLLAAATLVIYNPVNHNPFVNFDDDRYVTNNVHVRSGLNGSTVRWAFTTTEQANWHPLTWISHALDCELFHLNPAGHHEMNVLFHALDVALLFLVLQYATGFTWRSLMVAALFALHPLNVESVAWIAERKTVLSMLFFLLGLLAYTWYARKPAIGRYLAVAVLYAFGLMAKPMVITFPFVLLLWDYWPLRRMFPEKDGHADCETCPASPFLWLFLEKIPLLLLSAASALITMKAQAQGGAVRSIMEYSLPVRIENAVVAYARYVAKTFWPWPLAPMYPHPGNSLPAWEVVVASLLLLLLTGMVLAARRQRYLAVGWCWFLGTLVPMIGLVQVGAAAMADRYAYLPCIGIFVMLCWSVGEALDKRPFSLVLPAVPAAAILLALAVVTHRQLDYWKDNVVLWSHTVQVTRDNFVAEDNLGGAFILAGRLDEALPHFREAVRINPWDPVGNLNLATHEQQAGNLKSAVDLYLKVVRMTPDAQLRANAYSNLGAAYRALGDQTRAKGSYELALQLNPENAHAWIGLGLTAWKAGDYGAAANLFSRALAIQPTDVGYLLLSQALQRAGLPNQAQAASQTARRLSSDLPQAQQSANQLLSD
jgi:tetratricopeptide (TPR) repeat protein